MELVTLRNPLKQAYQRSADSFSKKKENSYDEPIFVLDEEWNILKQQERECPESPLSKEQITNQRAKRERILARGFEASPYAKYKEHKEHERKTDGKQTDGKQTDSKEGRTQ